uniref:Uncharacterized protein n=1 Tax=Setaria digitata TaxID=48799 RepID=A0A915PPN5_9BILA
MESFSRNLCEAEAQFILSVTGNYFEEASNSGVEISNDNTLVNRTVFVDTPATVLSVVERAALLYSSDVLFCKLRISIFCDMSYGWGDETVRVTMRSYYVMPDQQTVCDDGTLKR